MFRNNKEDGITVQAENDPGEERIGNKVNLLSINSAPPNPGILRMQNSVNIGWNV